MALLIKASRERVEVPCNSMDQMKNLQMRIHMLRGAMAREKHPQYAIVTRVHTSCSWDQATRPSGKGKGKQFPKDAKDCKLLLYPKDSQFADILAKAGVKVDDITDAESVLNEPQVPNAPPDSTIQPTPTSDEPTMPEDIYRRFK